MEAPEPAGGAHPRRLADYDLVLTSFETLRTELDHTPPAEGAAAAGGADRVLRRGARAQRARGVADVLAAPLVRVVAARA